MPTATDVDNRPLAIGKWPRLRSTGSNRPSNNHALRRPNNHGNSAAVANHHQAAHHNSQQHRDWCTLENCIHSCDEGSNICTDVLLQPELLHEFYGDRSLTSSNPLLEFCLDGGFSRKFCEGSKNVPNKALPSLLSHCSSLTTCSDLSGPEEEDFFAKLSLHLRQTRCDTNVQDSQGFTALHHLIQGCSKENVSLILKCTQLLLSSSPDGIDLSLAESRDDDTALTQLRLLMDRNVPVESLTQLASGLLRHKADVDHINGQQRTLLTYAVAKGDTHLELTRMLLNHGARIVPARATDVLRDRSAFTWLVKSIMAQQGLEGHAATLQVLCQNMAEVEGPEVMRSHVLSTMIHLGHSASVMGPLFVQLRSLVAPFWSQPLALIHLCRKQIRHALGPKNVSEGVASLSLPPSLTQYLHYF